MLSCRVLGTTEVSAGPARVELGGPLPRRLLTALLVADGRAVPDDRLADAVWADDAPAQASVSLQAYVSRLRRSLGPGGRDALQRTGTGYRLMLGERGTDVASFVAGVDEGRALLRGDRPSDAVAAFGAALRLWRGEAYADLPDWPDAAAARVRLHELREVAVEERLAAVLATGDAPAAAAELDAAVRAAPYRERRWELLILALYRSGRQGDAFAALRRVRRLLATELGVDPGPELQRLERRLLAQDPRLLLPDPVPVPVPVIVPSPTGRRPVRPLSAFVGRSAELDLLTELAATHRLVTLVGPGGAGKTRLAVEYAAARPDADVWLVRLADVSDARVLTATVAAAVGVLERAGDPGPALATALAGRPGLLVLDNVEHLVADVAELVLTLLADCPDLRVLATGREPLGVDGEHILPVAPLPPDAAVALLVDRIGAVRPGWTPDPAERAGLGELATALDGIPLALELAAARARVLGVRELVEHLDDKLTVLGAVPRGALAPHATLEAAIAWSVDLLSGPDRAMLLKLWPFEGGFTLEAAAAVSGPSALASLSSLVARSVVAADTTVTPTRYRLLEIVRAYCRGRDPEPGVSREAHARWVRELAERGAVDLRGERSAHTIRLLNRELPNLRAGIAHDLERAPAAAVRTTGLLDWFWFRGGHVAEGQRLLETALSAAPDAPGTDRARAWASYGALRFIGGDLEGAAACLDQVAADLGTPEDLEGHILLGQVSYYEALMLSAYGDFAAAGDRARDAVELGRTVNAEWIVSGGEMSLGAALVGLGEVGAGRETLRLATRRALACGQVWTAAMSELMLARSLVTDDPADALSVLRRSLNRFRDEDDVGNVLACLRTGAYALTVAGRPGDGAQLLAAVRHHAARRGLRPEVSDPVGAAALDKALAAALSPARRFEADQAGALLDVAAMTALLTAA